MTRRHRTLAVAATAVLFGFALGLAAGLRPASVRAQGAAGAKLEWEDVNSSHLTLRARLPGGWLVRTGGNDAGVTYVPDPAHTWDGGSSR